LPPTTAVLGHSFLSKFYDHFQVDQILKTLGIEDGRFAGTEANIRESRGLSYIFRNVKISTIILINTLIFLDTIQVGCICPP